MPCSKESSYETPDSLILRRKPYTLRTWAEQSDGAAGHIETPKLTLQEKIDYVRGIALRNHNSSLMKDRESFQS
jgi:hypothetical protein